MSEITVGIIEKKQTLYQYLTERGLTPAACGGKGICGRCRVRFCGQAPLPKAAERAHFSPQQLRQGYRLACLQEAVTGQRLVPLFDREEKIQVVEEFLPQEAGGTLDVSAADDAAADGRTAIAKAGGRPVIAVDLGTTTIAMQLRDQKAGKVYASYRCLNPQRKFGADVISRLQAAAGTGAARKLRQLVTTALETGFRQLLEKAERSGLPAPERAFLAGNTAMCHLLLGWDTDRLGKYPFEPCSLTEQRTELAGIKTCILPGISAFVGADIWAGILACGMAESAETVLLIDLGTNGEMALAHKGKCLCTATAAGPAFEGGANVSVPGSDMITILSDLLRQNKVDRGGLLAEPYFSKGILWGGVRIFQQDVRALQMAKAAVRAGVEVLLQKAGIRGSQVDQVYLAGGFGYFLDVESAFTIGLMPEAFRGKVIAAGNTALQGAWLYGTADVARRKVWDAFLNKVQVCNLAQQEAFQDIYIGQLDFDDNVHREDDRRGC